MLTPWGKVLIHVPDVQALRCLMDKRKNVGVKHSLTTTCTTRYPVTTFVQSALTHAEDATLVMISAAGQHASITINCLLRVDMKNRKILGCSKIIEIVCCVCNKETDFDFLCYMYFTWTIGCIVSQHRKWNKTILGLKG